MTHQLSHQEFLIGLAVAALGQARITYDQLFNAVIPSLPPQRRLFTEEIMHRLTTGNLFDEAFIHDLAALVATLKHEISDGTEVAWITDECDTGARITSGISIIAHRRWTAQPMLFPSCTA